MKIKIFIKLLVAITIMLLAVVIVLCLRFANPDMTETQFLIAFWPPLLFALTLLIIASILFKYETKDIEDKS